MQRNAYESAPAAARHSALLQCKTCTHVLPAFLAACSLPDLCSVLGVPPEAILAQQSTHIAASLLLLAAPGAAAVAFECAATGRLRMASNAAAGGTAHCNGAAAAGDASTSKVSFLRMAYSLLPLVWAASLAYYKEPLLTELGLVLPRLALTFGVAADADWLQMLPTIGPAAGAVVGAAQGCTLLLGCVMSCALAGQIAAAGVGWRQQGVGVRGAVARQRVTALVVTAVLWSLML
jgi:hypothetical protein